MIRRLGKHPGIIMDLHHLRHEFNAVCGSISQETFDHSIRKECLGVKGKCFYTFNISCTYCIIPLIYFINIIWKNVDVYWELLFHCHTVKKQLIYITHHHQHLNSSLQSAYSSSGFTDIFKCKVIRWSNRHKNLLSDFLFPRVFSRSSNERSATLCWVITMLEFSHSLIDVCFKIFRYICSYCSVIVP